MMFADSRRRKRVVDKRSVGKAEKKRQQGQYVRLTDMSRQRLLGYAESFRELSEKFRQESGREMTVPDLAGEVVQSRDRQAVLEERREGKNCRSRGTPHQ